MTVLGNQGETIVKEQIVTSTSGSRTVEYEMPTGYSFSPPSTSGGFPLRSISETTAGGKKTITANYALPNTSKDPTPSPVGTITKEADGTAQEVPIESHPYYRGDRTEENGPPVIETGSGYVEKPGVESYLIPGAIYTRTEVVSGFVWSEDNVVSGTGLLSSPTGLTGASANKWLKTGRTVREEGSSAIITETWQYAPNGWDEDIYLT